jgi:hypothetical protein
VYKVEEFGDVFADACLRDAAGRFVFLSVFGRDTALQQFMAAMELPQSEQGITCFHLLDSDQRHAVDVGGTNRLTKFTGHLPRQGIFGPLSHVWIYDKQLSQPDFANRIGWALHHGSAVENRSAKDAALARHVYLADRVWMLLKRLSPVPLLDHWRTPVMDWGWSTGVITRLDDPYPPLGPLAGARVSLGEGYLPHISDLVQRGVLTLEPRVIATPHAAPRRLPAPLTTAPLVPA